MGASSEIFGRGSRNGEQDKLIGICPTSVIAINGMELTSVVDCGSQVTTITSDCFQRSFPPSTLKDLNWISLSAANGTDIPYSGYFEADVTIAGITVPERGILVTNTTHKPKHPILLGMNVLQGLPVETLATVIGADASVVTSKNLIDKNSTVGLVRVAGRGKVRIPARSIQAIEVTGPTCPTQTAVIVDQIVQTPKGIILSPTLAHSCRGRITVQLYNTTDEDIFLNTRTPIGSLQLASMIDDNSVLCQRMVASGDQQADTGRMKLLETPGLLWQGLSEEQRQQAEALLLRNSDVFAASEEDLGHTETVTHRIRTVDEEPVKLPCRRIPPSQLEEVREHIRKLLEKKVIKESTSPYASPIVLVRKKDGSLRLCVDYRKLNQKTRKDAYPIPRIDESMDALHGAQ